MSYRYTSIDDDHMDNGYAPNNGGSYQMSQMPGSNATSDFFSQIASLQDRIRAYDALVARIGGLHTRTINSANVTETQRLEHELNDLSEQARDDSSSIKAELQALRRKGVRNEGEKNQIQRLAENFKNSVQQYQTVEKQYRQGVQERMKRQFKIVQPDASPEQVNEVVNNPGNNQIFSQALMSSNRYGEARTAYREVQERHEELKKIEQTMTELAQLFNDLSVLVNQQQETIDVIQSTAAQVEQDVEKGDNQLVTAVKSAANARKGRKICLGISIVVIIIIAAVVAGVICGQGNCGGGGGNNQPQ